MKKKWEMWNKFARRYVYPDHKDIMARDWDNLIILDACRYDLFLSCNTLNGEVECYYSNASNTAEFVRKTFVGEHYPDTVCVTATPKYIKPNAEDAFHDVIHVWEDDWNDEARTVLPEVMVERVISAHKKYPNKRLISHFIPPHLPFIGEIGQQIPHSVAFLGDLRGHDRDKQNIWNAMSNGGLEIQRVWSAYKENLELTLPAIENLLDKLPGKSVVTSDHGNAFGEAGIFGHPSRRHIEPLVCVPWFTADFDERKETLAEETNKRSNIDEETISDRLRDLGYIE